MPSLKCVHTLYNNINTNKSLISKIPILTCLHTLSGPTASNQKNLYTFLIALVLGRYRVSHADMNGTE